MQSMTEQQHVWWERTRTRGKTRFVLIAAAIWFAMFGLMPLSFLLAHALVPVILPILLGIALVAALLVGDVAWHFLECAHLERFGGAMTPRLEHRRRTLTWFLVPAFVAPLLSLLIDIADPNPLVIGTSALGVLVLLVGVLAAFERSIKRMG